ncbi:hypothetical protein [Streptomyces chiangmaiensis]|uniref:Uncharacterized protein n=1 Tax=Streptomyces chiangmaiensis TaxID=766497 RepID=A0ABU7FNX7_9ACTN|nr:hypothetical protein [Streptomyces chiangmaiensis]MED7825093.1 hypothetical protein [Streptomyces chiangmaiensis]
MAKKLVPKVTVLCVLRKWMTQGASALPPLGSVQRYWQRTVRSDWLHAPGICPDLRDVLILQRFRDPGLEGGTGRHGGVSLDGGCLVKAARIRGFAGSRPLRVQGVRELPA